MEAAVLTAQGAPEVLALADRAMPEPAEHEVLVRVAATGVNYVDVYQRSGAYQVSLPFTPGIEGAGVIAGIGAAVEEFGIGDRVAWIGPAGSYAEYCLVPQKALVPVPDELGLAQAASALIHGMTAHALAHDVARLTEGSSCLVHAAAGGIGALLCQYAAGLGATVIGTVSSAEKAEVARAAGAHDVVVGYEQNGFASQVKRLTGGGGVDVVLDGVGRATALESLDCLRPRGLLVLYGQTSGPVAPIDPQVLAAKGSLFVTKASLGHYNDSRTALLDRAAAVFGAVLDGRLQLRVHAGYPLGQAAQAHRDLESRAAMGKVLLFPAGADPDW